MQTPATALIVRSNVPPLRGKQFQAPTVLAAFRDDATLLGRFKRRAGEGRYPGRSGLPCRRHRRLVPLWRIDNESLAKGPTAANATCRAWFARAGKQFVVARVSIEQQLAIHGSAFCKKRQSMVTAERTTTLPPLCYDVSRGLAKSSM